MSGKEFCSSTFLTLVFSSFGLTVRSKMMRLMSREHLYGLAYHAGNLHDAFCLCPFSYSSDISLCSTFCALLFAQIHAILFHTKKKTVLVDESASVFLSVSLLFFLHRFAMASVVKRLCETSEKKCVCTAASPRSHTGSRLFCLSQALSLTSNSKLKYLDELHSPMSGRRVSITRPCVIGWHPKLL